MKTEAPRLSDEHINDLPRTQYQGSIVFADTAEAARAALAGLAGDTLLGFDTETRASFRKGEVYEPALIQLAGERQVVLIRLCRVGLMAEIRALLSDSAVIKAGLALNRDVQDLQRMHAFRAAGFVDVATVAHRHELGHYGLRGLAALLLGERISKGPRTTNWAMPQLTPAQTQYAATDAWITRRIYLAMRERGLN